MEVSSLVACTINILQSQMMPLELSVSDATIMSIAVESLIVILEASFTIIYDVYRTGVTLDDCSMFILQATSLSSHFITL
jgi:hypothetical protein